MSIRAAAIAEGLLEAAPDPILVVDRAGAIVLVNREAERSFGYPRAALMGRAVDLLVPDDHRTAHRAHRRDYGRAPSTRAMGDNGLVSVRRADGSTYPAEISLSPLETAEGRLVIAIVRDVTRRVELETQLRYLVTHDALTGLYNRAYLDTECARLDRGRAHPIGVLSIDADDLKRVNDAEGHEAGDVLLRRIAAVLMCTFRGDDVVARVGGDEFLVLLPRHDVGLLTRARSRLAAAIRIEHRGSPHAPLSVSIGSAVAHAGQPVRDAIRRADLAMLANKQRRKRGRAA